MRVYEKKALIFGLVLKNLHFSLKFQGLPQELLDQLY